MSQTSKKNHEKLQNRDKKTQNSEERVTKIDKLV